MLNQEEVLKVLTDYGLTPLIPYPGADKPWLCRHTCGSESSPRFTDIRRGFGICRRCSDEQSARRRAIPEATARDIFVKAKLAPLEPYPYSSRKPWKSECLECGSIVSPSIFAVRNSKIPCKICSEKKKAQNTVAQHAKSAQIVLELSGFQPIEDYQGAKVPWNCQCKKCKTPRRVTLTQARRGLNCEVCNPKHHEKKIAMSSKDAAELYKSFSLELVQEYRNQRFAHSVLCDLCGGKDSISLGSLKARTKKFPGCRNCQPNRAITETEAISELRKHGLEPLAPYPGAENPWPSLCLTCRNQVTPRLRGLNQGKSCFVCSKKKMALNQRLPIQEALDALMNVGVVPVEPYPGSVNKPWASTHIRCGRSIAPSYSSIRRGQNPCKFCSIEKQTDSRRLKEADAVAVMQSANLEPLEPFEKAGLPWLCRCTKCQGIVKPRLSQIKGGGGGCVTCASGFGFDVNKPGWVYLIEREGQLQLGITNYPDQRIRQQHGRNDWVQKELRGAFTGHDARSIEKALLFGLDANGIKRGKDAFKTPFEGYTEAWDSAELFVLDLHQLATMLSTEEDVIKLIAEKPPTQG